MTKCSMSAVSRPPRQLPPMPAGPSPNGPLTASLASAPPVRGNPARLSASTAAEDQRHRSAARGRSRRRRPWSETGRPSPGHGSPHRRRRPAPRLVGRQQTHAERRGDHAHLADARIGEHRLRDCAGSRRSRRHRRRRRSPASASASPQPGNAAPKGRKRMRPMTPALTAAPLSTAAAGMGAAV